MTEEQAIKLLTVLTHIETVRNGNYITSISNENWLAKIDLNPMAVLKMLEVAYHSGRRDAYLEQRFNMGSLEQSEMDNIAAIIRYAAQRVGPREESAEHEGDA